MHCSLAPSSRYRPTVVQSIHCQLETASLAHSRCCHLATHFETFALSITNCSQWHSTCHSLRDTIRRVICWSPIRLECSRLSALAKGFAIVLQGSISSEWIIQWYHSSRATPLSGVHVPASQYAKGGDTIAGLRQG
jgi:hypothetical protein